MFLGGFMALMSLVALAGLVLLVMALVDMFRRPTDVWEASGQNQLVWALVVIFVTVIGPVLYLVIARPILETAASPPLSHNHA